jgi:hypothetical protein
MKGERDMNDNRNYGIELEFACKVNHAQLAIKINTAFNEAGLDHLAICNMHYHRNTDGLNVRNWDVKTDGSIQAPDINTEHPYGIEIASPVLKGEDGLKALKVVCSVLDGIARVGKTTGLHVHHAVKSNELTKIAKSWVKVQDSIYLMVPFSRRANRYCAKWHAWDADNIPNVGIRNWYRRNVGGRYVGLNMESFWLRGTVEFRLAAGSVDYGKISNWVIFTQMLLDKASTIATQPSYGIDFSSLITLLRSTLGSRSAGITNVPQEGTKSRMVWDMAREGQCRQAILFNLRRTFGEGEYRISSIMKAANGCSSNTVVRDNDNRLAAIEWAEQRYAKFHMETA